MANRFEKLAEEARQKTNEQLADELTRVTPLTQEQLDEMLPTKRDKENLARLMAIVQSATSQNEKVAALRDNIDDLGGVAVKILGSIF